MIGLYKKIEILLKLLKSESTVLAKAGDDDDYGEDLASHGIHEFDPFDDNSGDDADQWLKEHGKNTTEEPAASTAEENPEAEEKEETSAVAPARSSGSFKEWQAEPHRYSTEQKEAMGRFIKEGYSAREAEKLANAHKNPASFQEALHTRVRHSQPSEKMLDELEGAGDAFYTNAMRQEDKLADPEKNPIKHAAGKIHATREDYKRAYKEAYNKFLGSPDYKDVEKDPLKAHHAVENFKKQWHSTNPEYKQNIEKIMKPGEHVAGAKAVRKMAADDAIQHILHGGVGVHDTMSAAEAAQHVGGVQNDSEEGGGYTSTVERDPASSFARQNPEFLESKKKQLAAKSVAAIKAKMNPADHAKFDAAYAKTQGSTMPTVPKIPKGEE